MSKSSILPRTPFKGVRDYCAYWDKVVAEIMSGGGRFADAIRNQAQGQEDNLRRGTTTDNVIAYGDPVPANVADAMQRTYFLNLQLYNNAYNSMKPFLAKLEKMSNGIIPQNVIKPNDRELGIFSFERAMMSLQGATGLCVQKGDKKTFYKMNDGTPIIEKDKQKKDKEGRLLFKIEKNGETAFLTQLEEDGDKRWISLNKKSFLYKEKHPRPKRIVRIFILIGQNWGRVAYWAGVTAVILANFLEGRGYAVRVTAAIGLSNSGLNFGGTNKEYGSRYNMIDVKGYDETMDTLSLLYVLADPSFFRIRQFKYYLAQQYKNKDELDTSLGGMPSIDDFEESLNYHQKQKFIAEEKDALYYFIGGREVTDEISAQENLIRIVCEAENKNKEILSRLMGVQFTPTDPSANNYDDIDCTDERTWGRRP